MLQNNTTIDGQVIYAGEVVVKAKYLCSMQENINLYWEQHPLQQTIIFTTCTIIHPRLDVMIIGYVQYTPKIICSRNHKKKKYKDIQLL